MKINIILESGEIIQEQITESNITKQDLFLKYLDGYIEMDDWFITIHGIRQPKREVYSNDDYDPDYDPELDQDEW